MRETDTDLWTPWNAPSRHPRPTPPTGSTTATKSVTYVPGLICYRCPRLFRVQSEEFEIRNGQQFDLPAGKQVQQPVRSPSSLFILHSKLFTPRRGDAGCRRNEVTEAVCG